MIFGYHLKYLGAFNAKPFLRYPGSILVTFVYNMLFSVEYLFGGKVYISGVKSGFF